MTPVGRVLSVALVTGLCLPGPASWAFAQTSSKSATPATKSATPARKAAAPTARKATTPTARKATAPAARKATASRSSATSAAARRASLAKARPAKRARVVREPFPRFKLDAASGSLVPDLHAAAAIIYNPETDEVLWEENSQDKRSIASITKVMTAVVFIESAPDLTERVTVDRSDVWRASVTSLRAGEVLTVNDLLHLALIASDNGAARVLARISPWGSEGFVSRMNEKALELGLTSTAYADPSGLDPGNVSCAYDMARLITYAGADERIGPIMRTPQHTLTTSRHTFTIRSTNQLLRGTGLNVMGGKTGFIRKAGYCLATLLKLPGVDQPFAVVVLGAQSNAARFFETRNLYQWLSGRLQQLVAAQPGLSQP